MNLESSQASSLLQLEDNNELFQCLTEEKHVSLSKI